MWDVIATKNIIIKMLSENFNKITISFYISNDSDLLTKRQQNLIFVYPKGNNSKAAITLIYILMVYILTDILIYTFNK